MAQRLAQTMAKIIEARFGSCISRSGQLTRNVAMNYAAARGNAGSASSGSSRLGLKAAGGPKSEDPVTASAPPEDDPTRGGDKFYKDLQAPKDEALFSCVRTGSRPSKPRGNSGLTEIRGPYYKPMGLYYLQDLLGGMGHAVDGFKFAGGSFRVMNKQAVIELIQECHVNDVYVSTGAWIEYVLTQGRETVQAYLQECKDSGFDVVELSARLASMPEDDLLRLVEDVHKAGLRAKPEVGIQWGARGDTHGGSPDDRDRSNGTTEAIRRAKRCLEAGAEMVLVQSEGIITDGGPGQWRADVVARFVEEVGSEKLMFEAASPEVFAWYVKTVGVEVNLLVDHSQIVQLETLRRGIWGTDWLRGRVLTYK